MATKKLRHVSMDSEPSILADAEASIRPNHKCARPKCRHKFYLAPKETIIMCPACGYRILDKLRTRNHITYKTV